MLFRLLPLGPVRFGTVGLGAPLTKVRGLSIDPPDLSPEELHQQLSALAREMPDFAGIQILTPAMHQWLARARVLVEMVDPLEATTSDQRRAISLWNHSERARLRT